MNKHELRDLYIQETGNPFPDDVARYADWLEEKLIDRKYLKSKLSDFLKSQRNVSPEIVEAVNDNFWELI